MKITRILTNRDYESWPSWHLVHEWEDILSKSLNLKLQSSLTLNRLYTNSFVKKLLSYNVVKFYYYKVDSYFKRKNKYIVFELFVNPRCTFNNRSNSVPIIIDFFKYTNLKNFNEAYKNCEVVLITSIEVFNFLKENRSPVNIKHFPLSLSDIYKSGIQTPFVKKYDIILAGRRNKVLWVYMKEFSEKYPAVEYLYQEQIDGKLCYISNKQGNIGCFHSREKYMTLLQSCKIAFYATPGIDGGEERTGGFNPVTPRFLEYLSAKCFILGRYPDNDEVRFYEVSKVCPQINSYNDLETTLLFYLNKEDVPITLYEEILNKHYTSLRALQLVEILNSINHIRN